MKVLAKWWQPLENSKVRCELCPRFCEIGDGQNGYCSVRRNEGGKLYLMAYGRPIGLHIDPIEKKPLYHFYPGTSILSFGTVGCSLGCRFCQNWDMSNAKVDERRSSEATPEQIVQLAIRHNCPAIAYTYNEPTIFGEFLLDTAKLAKANGIRNVMVTNGYITPEARQDIYPYIDAANVDLKAFSEKFYYKLTGAHLSDVLDTIRWLAGETDVWIEITNLIIPGYNDNMDEVGRMVDWILDNCGDDVPLHFSAFHPDHKMLDVPRTPPEMLTQASNLAIEKGMKYVFSGNVYNPEEQATFCPCCGEKVIERDWHNISGMYLTGDKCRCGQRINGVFEPYRVIQ